MQSRSSLAPGFPGVILRGVRPAIAATRMDVLATPLGRFPFRAGNDGNLRQLLWARAVLSNGFQYLFLRDVAQIGGGFPDAPQEILLPSRSLSAFGKVLISRGHRNLIFQFSSQRSHPNPDLHRSGAIQRTKSKADVSESTSF